jgi:RNAse (barnase) inhibitor barstar
MLEPLHAIRMNDKKEIVIDGNQFSTPDEFYDEVEKKLVWNKWGRNLNAFNDILYGGFGSREFEEPFVLIWRNTEKSKQDLGYQETVRRLKILLENCHRDNRDCLQQELKKIENGTGETIFDLLIAIIEGHSHIEFRKE